MGLTTLDWLIAALASAAAFAYAGWHYFRREERRPLTWLLVLLRGSALAGAALLLLDPTVPAFRATNAGGAAILLDGSLSMSRPLGTSTLWAAARDSARVMKGALWMFGASVPAPVHPDSLPVSPPFLSSDLAPALRAVAQRGVRNVRVITDGELTDPAEAAEVARRYGLRVEVVRLGAPYPRVSLAEVLAAPWAQAAETLDVRTAVATHGVSSGGVRLAVIDSAERVRAQAVAPIGSPGRMGEVTLRLPVGSAPGLQRFEVALQDEGSDLERRDDRRVIYVEVAGPPRGAVLLALEPSWEARFLLPNLARAGEAPARGYMQVRPGNWVAMGDPGDGVRPVAAAEVARRAAESPLRVVLGYGPGAPAWVHEIVRRGRRVWIFPSRPGFELPGWGVRVGALEVGEWYPDAPPPPSPLAGVLAGIDVSLFPPLTGVRSVDGPGAWVPLHVRLGRRGTPRPALVAGTAGDRRWAVAAGMAYWRWGFRPGGPGQLYRGLMTGVAAWLLEAQPEAGESIRVLERVVSMGGQFRFLLPAASDSAQVTLTDTTGARGARGARGATRWDTTVVGPPDTLMSVAMPVGRYWFQARAWRAGRLAAQGAGPVEVEPFHPELVYHPVIDSAWAPLMIDTARSAPITGEGRAAEGRPLRRQGWPFALLVALLCTEWALRRRLGLR